MSVIVVSHIVQSSFLVVILQVFFLWSLAILQLSACVFFVSQHQLMYVIIML